MQRPLSVWHTLSHAHPPKLGRQQSKPLQYAPPPPPRSVLAVIMSLAVRVHSSKPPRRRSAMGFGQFAHEPSSCCVSSKKQSAGGDDAVVQLRLPLLPLPICDMSPRPIGVQIGCWSRRQDTWPLSSADDDRRQNCRLARQKWYSCGRTCAALVMSGIPPDESTARSVAGRMDGERTLRGGPTNSRSCWQPTLLSHPSQVCNRN